jgi:hypothetical protein
MPSRNRKQFFGSVNGYATTRNSFSANSPQLFRRLIAVAESLFEVGIGDYHQLNRSPQKCYFHH